jgi:hypothetical protein
METAQSTPMAPEGNALVFIRFPSIGTISLDLTEVTNVNIAETILKEIKEKLKKKDVKNDVISPIFPAGGEPNLSS